jgi:hypothetical protein
MSSSRYFAILGLILAGNACPRQQPNYCPEELYDNCMNKGLDAMTPDMASACGKDCTPDVCDISSRRCVQCTATNSTACSQETPVCGDNNMCRACKDQADCLSQICLNSGACVPVIDVAYVQSGYGTCTDAASCCTQTMPCGSLNPALTTKRPYVKIASGTIRDSAAIIDSTKINQISSKITILGDPGAILTINTQGPVLTIQGSVNVEIHDLELKGALGSAPGQGDGIRLIPDNGDPSEVPTLNLVHVTIDNNMEHGIHATAGILSVTRSTISDNDKGGVVVSDSATKVTITNSFIYGNGKDTDNTDTSTGGLMLLPTRSGQLLFNTIVSNNSSASQEAGGAISKTSSSNALSVVSANHNIIVKNTVNKNGAGDNTQTNIIFLGDSFIRGNPTSGDLKFRNPPTDYHLLQGIMVIDAVTDATACFDIGVDFGSDARPQGSKCDLGADEWAPGQNK